ncbi:DUF2237 domain-containing protein [Pacificimonas sp. WHA3]|uniref:DUF2237 domain-containing protein n=1 Tax=Pacificimonas pallii TaxID=2827236 RepID=A0ABS6SED6_9SPHN|nr:DUF2237 domain-containing protein [Pacificimonas pallii]MBV7256777.1 DUF2237 domain-containing protein [Pacificimonas pallii]
MSKGDVKNVIGGKLADCSHDPLTGWHRDGCCHSIDEDIGNHSVCAVMTDEFLAFSKAAGNDLSTPRPEFLFPGLKAGDQWCVCAARWEEARQGGAAPLVMLAATHERALEVLQLGHLQAHAADEADA